MGFANDKQRKGFFANQNTPVTKRAVPKLSTTPHQLEKIKIKQVKISDINDEFEPLPDTDSSYKLVDELMVAIQNNKKIPPILINRSGFLEDGRHRLSAYRRLGFVSVPTITGFNPNVDSVSSKGRKLKLKFRTFRGQPFQQIIK